MLRPLVVVAAVLSLAASAQAATPVNVLLAKTVKTAIAKVYKAKGSPDVFTKVTCVYTSGATKGTCKAYFTSAAQQEKGYFNISIKVNLNTGGFTWLPTKVTCTNAKTGKNVAC